MSELDKDNKSSHVSQVKHDDPNDWMKTSIKMFARCGVILLTYSGLSGFSFLPIVTADTISPKYEDIDLKKTDETSSSQSEIKTQESFSSSKEKEVTASVPGDQTTTTQISPKEEQIVAPSSQSSIVDTAQFSLTQSSVNFYADAAAPDNVHTVNLNANNLIAGETIVVELNLFKLRQVPVINGAHVTLEGTSLKIVFNQSISGSISVPLDLMSTLSSDEKKLSDIQDALSSGVSPGIKPITATDTKGSNVYTSSVSINVQLISFSTPISITFNKFAGGQLYQNQVYDFNGVTTSTFANDGKNHEDFQQFLSSANYDTYHLVMPQGFVLMGGVGWTQSGNILTYNGTGGATASFSGKFTSAPGTYTATDNSTRTGYFGYSTSPVTVSTVKPISVTILDPASILPSLGYVSNVNQKINQVPTSQLYGRTVAATDASTSLRFFTGGLTVSNAHWSISPQSLSQSSVIIKQLTIPQQAKSAVITFKDGTKQTYGPGQVVNLSNSSNLVTSLDLEFGQLDASASIDLPMKYAYQNTTGTLSNLSFIQSITGVRSDGSVLRNQTNTDKVTPVGSLPGLDVLKAFSSRAGFSTTATVLQYGSGTTASQFLTVSSVQASSTDVGSNQIYEPIIYQVLPLGVDFQGVTGGTLGYQFTTTTISTGQTVVKIDYTGSGKLISLTSGTTPVVNYKVKPYGLTVNSTVYGFISTKNDPAMTLTTTVTSGPTASLVSEITQGDIKAVLAGQKLVPVTGTSYLMGGTSITDNQGITSSKGINDFVNGGKHSLNIDLINSTTLSGGSLQTLTNLTDATDGLTLNLTNAGILKNAATGQIISDPTMGEILYSTQRQTLTSGKSINLSGYLPASQIMDWAKIKSFVVKIAKLDTNVEYTVNLPLNAPDASHQLNQPVTLTTFIVGDKLDTQVSTTDQFIYSGKMAHATLHYDANSGDSLSVPEDQTTPDFFPTDTGSLTISSTVPTKTSDELSDFYIFKGWNTHKDGSGTAYKIGDTLSNLLADSTLNLYAQWEKVKKPLLTIGLSGSMTGLEQYFSGESEFAGFGRGTRSDGNDDHNSGQVELSLVNDSAYTYSNPQTVVVLPNGKTTGSFAVQLTGPVENIVGTGASVVYSSKTYNLPKTSSNQTIDLTTTDWVNANQVEDWGAIRSIALEAPSLDASVPLLKSSLNSGNKITQFFDSLTEQINVSSSQEVMVKPSVLSAAFPVSIANINQTTIGQTATLQSYTFAKGGEANSDLSLNRSMNAQIYGTPQVTARYLETKDGKTSDGKVLSDPKTYTGVESNKLDESTYTTLPKTIPGYTYKGLSPDSEAPSGVFTDKLGTISYLYTQDQQKLVIHYINVSDSSKNLDWEPVDGQELKNSQQQLSGGSGDSYTNMIAIPKGYELAGESKGATGGKFDSDTPTTQNEYVYIKTMNQKVVYNVIDDSIGKTLEKETLLDEGGTGTSLNISVKDVQAIANQYVLKGYVIRLIDPLPQTFDSDPTVNQMVNIHLTHDTVIADVNHPGQPGGPINSEDPTGPKWPKGTGAHDLSKSITRTINYLNQATGEAIVSPVTEVVTYLHTTIIDKTTGEIIGYDTNRDGESDTTVLLNAWLSNNKLWRKIDSPNLSSKGYGSASIDSIKEVQVGPESKDVVVNVYYNASTQIHSANVQPTNQKNSTLKKYSSKSPAHLSLPQTGESKSFGMILVGSIVILIGGIGVGLQRKKRKNR